MRIRMFMMMPAFLSTTSRASFVLRPSSRSRSSSSLRKLLPSSPSSPSPSSSSSSGKGVVGSTSTAFSSRLLVERRAYTTNDSNNNERIPAEDDHATKTTTASTTTRTDPPVWNHPRVDERIKNKRRKKNARFRQHVNPLARRYQQPAVLSQQWPCDVFDDLSRPLHLDIGCAKGQFLIDMASSSSSDDGEDTAEQHNHHQQQQYNYLGLEVRPLVAQFAKERIAIHKLTGKLDFIGCNANVDLDRILARYQQASSTTSSGNNQEQLKLRRVSIQFPDPHFKSHHAKRRVVNEELVNVLAKFLSPGRGRVFLQSDVKTVCDDMKQRFRSYGAGYFRELLDDDAWGMMVPTEREVSVLKKGLPVYKALFARTSQPYNEFSSNDEID